MLRDRDANGKLQVNPDKFPLGWEDVTSFIHSLGMKSGLYTSKSQYTCAGFNASCMHEMIDAATFASWNVDYVKEDSCGGCRQNDTEDYVQMALAITASGRPMVQTDEGAPDNFNCSTYGGCGNAKRVGHDISPSYTSMQSLVDMASGLWVYAHNSTDGRGGWWNDLECVWAVAFALWLRAGCAVAFQYPPFPVCFSLSYLPPRPHPPPPPPKKQHAGGGQW